MVNLLKCYSVQLMKLPELLKPLLRKNVQWTWDSTRQAAFDTIKEELIKTPALIYFNPKSEQVMPHWKDWVQYCDKVVAQRFKYPKHSRLLGGTIRTLRSYVYGEPVHVQTDHKHLDNSEEVSCYRKPKTSKAILKAGCHSGNWQSPWQNQNWHYCRYNSESASTFHLPGLEISKASTSEYMQHYDALIFKADCCKKYINYPQSTEEFTRTYSKMCVHSRTKLEFGNLRRGINQSTWKKKALEA